jgi:hypothetical protein
MEALGAVASIAALLELSKELYLTISSLTRAYSHAPAELQRISNQLLLIQMELKHISLLENELQGGFPFSAPDLLCLEEAMCAAKANLLSIYQSSEKTLEKGRQRIQKIRWALSDKKVLEDLLSQLRTTESSLNVVLTIMNS